MVGKLTYRNEDYFNRNEIRDSVNNYSKNIEVEEMDETWTGNEKKTKDYKNSMN